MAEMYGYIYKIENLVNGKVYIGQTIHNFKKRKSTHTSKLNYNKHRNSHLQNAWNLYGESNFKFNIITWANGHEELNNAEIYYMKKYNSRDPNFGYNIRHGGNNGKMPPESRLKISKNNARYWKGKKRLIESRKKQSKSMKGREISIEHRKKIGEALKGKNHPFYGKKFSLEHRKKMSKSQRGRGKFGFTGVHFLKNMKPDRKCWQSIIRHNNKLKHLGVFHDPLSAEIVYNLVKNEICDWEEKYL